MGCTGGCSVDLGGFDLSINHVEEDSGTWEYRRRGRHRKSKAAVMELCSMEDEKWDTLGMDLDSGAAETVIPTGSVPGVKVRRDNGKEGTTYRVANGNVIPNRGEKRMVWKSKEGFTGNINAQVTDVTKGLISVSNICDAGNWVVFGPKGGWIEQVATGRKNHFGRNGKRYTLEILVKARNAEDQVMAVTVEAGEEESGPTFSWQDFLQ